MSLFGTFLALNLYTVLMNRMKKKKFGVKPFNMIICSALLLLTATFIIVLFAFNDNYCKIYKSPEVHNGKVDFTGVELPNRNVACNLAGEWEFFYGRRIVTDSDEGINSTMINLPGLWTYKRLDGRILPKSGYASYKLIAENVQKDVDVVVFRHNENFSYRVFINGELNYVSGQLSKNPDETVVTGRTTESYPYHTDGSPLEIVIEVSATNFGGFNAAPWFAAATGGVSYGNSLRSFTYIALGVSVAAVAISILSLIFFSYNRDFTAPLFMCAMLVHFLSSKDMMYVIPLGYIPSIIISLVSAIGAVGLLTAHFIKNGVKYKKNHLLTASITSVISTVLLFIFYGTPYAPYAALTLIVCSLSLMFPPLLYGEFSKTKTATYGILLHLTFETFIFEFCDALGLLKFGTEFIFAGQLMTIIACFAVLWLIKIAQASKDAIRANNLEKQLTVSKLNAMKAQIKPHFIYNSLTAVQARYRQGLSSGAEALEKFSRYLRLITDSDERETIPFSEEVKNVMNYFELENLRYNGKLNLLLDLEYTDFKVPLLSIQPLIENAVRHANIAKEDKYVQICSQKCGEFAVITVSDNGDGFNPDDKKTGVGLENTINRFKLFNGQVEVKSQKDKGTSIQIKLTLG